MIDETANTTNSLRLFPYDPRFSPAVIPTAGVFDSPLFAVCVNAQWLSHIDGVVERLAWRDAWLGLPEEQQAAADEAIKILSAIASATPCGDGAIMFRLRQNPTNPCVLEQSFDDGGSWSTAFDYSLCGSGVTIDIDAGLTIINNDNSTYITNPSGFEAEITDADANTNIAICYALEVVIRASLDGILQRVKGQNNQNQIIQSVASAIAIVATFTFGPPGIALAVAIGLSIGLLASAVINEIEESEIETVIASDALIRELVCCAYDVLFDLRPTPELFAVALDTCATPSPALDDIIPALQVIFDNFSTFVQFLRMAGQAYDYAEAGVLGDLCASCDSWCVEFDFTTSTHGFSPTSRGEWINGVGWQNTEAGSICGVFIERIFDAAIVTGAEIKYSLDSGNLTRRVNVWFRNGGDEENVISQAPADVGDGIVKTDTISEYIADRFRLSVDTRTASGCLAGTYSRIHRARIFGIGFNPFGTSNC